MSIEEMTADQPADSRPAIHDDAAEFDAQVRVHYDRYEAEITRLHAQIADMQMTLTELAPSRESASASSVPGLSVCVAQLAAIRQPADSWTHGNLSTAPHPRGTWCEVDKFPAVFCGGPHFEAEIPGTTQPDEGDAGE